MKPDIDFRRGPRDGKPLFDNDAHEADDVVGLILDGMEPAERVPMVRGIRKTQERLNIASLGDQGAAELMLRIGLMDAIIRERKWRGRWTVIGAPIHLRSEL